MGAFTTTSTWIAGHLGEFVGYKAGLALTREELAEHLVDTPDIRDAVLVAEDYLLHMRSEEYEEIVEGLLYRVGNIRLHNHCFPCRPFTGDSNMIRPTVKFWIRC